MRFYVIKCIIFDKPTYTNLLMKMLKIISQRYILLTIFVSFLMINSIALWLGLKSFLEIVSLLLIPVLVTIYFYRKHYMANVFFTIFLIMFLGRVFDVFSVNDLMNNLSEAFYIGAYLLLIFVLSGKLKRVKFEGVVTIYLVIVFLVNVYLFYALYDALKTSFYDKLQLLLFVFKGIVLLFMAFTAFMVYLSNESKQSILFLTMVFCMMFSALLKSIHTMYVYFWVFEWVEYILLSLSLILFFKYVENHHHKNKIKPESQFADKQAVVNTTDSIIV